jgi:hypothetical protein
MIEWGAKGLKGLLVVCLMFEMVEAFLGMLRQTISLLL